MYSALVPIQSLRHSLEVSQKQCELVDLGDVQFFVVFGFFPFFLIATPKNYLLKFGDGISCLSWSVWHNWHMRICLESLQTL